MSTGDNLPAGREMDRRVANRIGLWYGFDPLHKNPAHFSTGFVDAMGALAALRASGFIVRITVGHENNPDYAGGPTATLDIWRADTPGVIGHGGTLNTVSAENSTGHSMDDLPLAICRAVLRMLPESRAE